MSYTRARSCLMCIRADLAASAEAVRGREAERIKWEYRDASIKHAGSVSLVNGLPEQDYKVQMQPLPTSESRENTFSTRTTNQVLQPLSEANCSIKRVLYSIIDRVFSHKNLVLLISQILIPMLWRVVLSLSRIWIAFKLCSKINTKCQPSMLFVPISDFTRIDALLVS